jgi:hypothetical protein
MMKNKNSFFYLFEQGVAGGLEAPISEPAIAASKDLSRSSLIKTRILATLGLLLLGYTVSFRWRKVFRSVVIVNWTERSSKSSKDMGFEVGILSAIPQAMNSPFDGLPVCSD